jgi:hypothetical protein
MAYSATVANMRGILSDDEHERLLGLFSRAGLSMDHHQFDEDILDKQLRQFYARETASNEQQYQVRWAAVSSSMTLR